MYQKISNLETLKAFTIDRPKLKAKVDELLEMFHIDSESGKSPIVSEISVYGGNDSYTDDGESANGSYVRSSQDLQEIEFCFTLINKKNIRAKLTQKRSNFKNVFRITFSEGLFGAKGKKHAEELIDEVLYIVENKINPFQDELDREKALLESRLRTESSIKKEMEQLEAIKESVPKAYNFLKNELWGATHYVNEARDKVKVVQRKFDNAEKTKEEK